MIVRPARTQDAVAIAAITNQVVRDTLVTFTTQERSPASIAEDIAARGPAFQVAERGNQVVGFATYGRFRTGPGYDATREHTIMLDPQAQGRGVVED
ncbi:putative phosphinothricin N-acetyltransferase [Ruegeria lacuscaerulensis ITI-1157]|nr:putative phosphinothricin N-acetyltransferase [Ruegeria lacuscaerulensis ITI-1157]